MTDEGDDVRTCQYQLDLNEVDVSYFAALFDAVEYGEDLWVCPRRVSREHDRCIFHRPIEAKDSAETQDSFLQELRTGQLIGGGTGQPLHIGAQFSSLRIPSLAVKPTLATAHTDSEPRIDLRFAEIQGECFLPSLSTTRPLYLNHCTIQGDLTLADSSFSDTVYLNEITVDGDLSLARTRFHDDLHADVAISGEVDLSASISTGNVSLRGTVDGKVNLSQAELKGDVALYCDCRSLDATKIRVEGDLSIGSAIGGGRSVALDSAVVRGTSQISCQAKKFSCCNTEFHGPVEFSRYRFEAPDGVAFHKTVFRDSLTFGISSNPTPTSLVEFTDAVIASGSLYQSPDAELVYTFNGASVGDVEFYSKSSAPLESVDFIGCRFDGFRFEKKRELLRDAEWRLHHLSTPTKRRLAVHSGIESDCIHLVVFLRHLINEVPHIRTLFESSADVRSFLQDFRSSMVEYLLDPEIQEQVLQGDLDPEAVTPFVHSERSPYDDWDELASEQVVWLADPADPRGYASAIATDVVRKALLKPPVDEDEPAEELLMIAVADPTEAEPSLMECEQLYANAQTDAASTSASRAASEFFIKANRFRRAGNWSTFRSSTSLHGKLNASWSILTNLLFDLTTGYGERPRRVILSSVGIVALFAAVYWAQGYQPATGNRAGDYLLFSAQNFITFILGVIPGNPPYAVQVSSALEGFIGAFFVALFVFTLTRTIHR